MPARIRLQRHGKKGQPFYYIVVADGRAPRDGRFIEKIGTYNPLTNPATIALDFERALYWVNCGVQPSDTARSLLRREGIYMKKHLLEGVQKGAFDEVEAGKKFEIWKTAKQSKINDYKLEIINASKSEAKKRFDVESKVRQEKENLANEKRLAELEIVRKKKEEADAKAAAERAEKEAAEAAKKADSQVSEETSAEEKEATSHAPVVTEEVEAIAEKTEATEIIDSSVSEETSTEEKEATNDAPAIPEEEAEAKTE